MNTAKSKRDGGFTIIEVALVLAIAGLIFLVVFLALPALQRNQRDDARKRDVASVVQSVASATANLNKAVTIGTAYDRNVALTSHSNLEKYIDQNGLSGNVDVINVRDKSLVGATQMLFSTTTATTPANTINAGNSVGDPRINLIIVYSGFKCWDGVSGSTNSGNVGIQYTASRSAAVVIQLESGGPGHFYCQNAG